MFIKVYLLVTNYFCFWPEKSPAEALFILYNYLFMANRPINHCFISRELFIIISDARIFNYPNLQITETNIKHVFFNSPPLSYFSIEASRVHAGTNTRLLLAFVKVGSGMFSLCPNCVCRTCALVCIASLT